MKLDLIPTSRKTVAFASMYWWGPGVGPETTGEFSLTTIRDALESLKITMRPAPLLVADRLQIACEKFGTDPFTRKAYLSIFKSISTATASRDLAFGVEHGKIMKTGEKALAKYRFSSEHNK